MFLNTEVEVLISKKNLDWYISKGYDCKSGDKLIVSSKDLMKSSAKLISYKCDRCGQTNTLKNSSFTKNQDINKNTYCVKCANEILVEEKRKNNIHLAKDGYKICIKCNRKLPADTDHFSLKCNTFDGFTSRCKECNGRKFTEHLTKIPRKGYKFCIKCGKELKNDIQFFPPDKTCKDGLRNVCRCCGKDGHYMEDGYVPNEYWSDNDLNLMKEKYKFYTGEELQKLYFHNRTIRAIECCADTLKINGKDDSIKDRQNEQRRIKCSEKLKGRKLSEETKIKISNTKIEYYKTHISYWKGRKRSKEQCELMRKNVIEKGNWSGDDNPRHKNPLNGKLNGNWKGGITNFYFELRSDTKEWKQDSMKFCNYKCVLTNESFKSIHHIHPFKDIVNETFNILNIDIRNSVCDYSESEFGLIRNKLIELHRNYGYGACLCEQLHKLFHDTYGYLNNTKEQFLEYVKELENGKYNDFLIENNIKLNINHSYIDYLMS